MRILKEKEFEVLLKEAGYVNYYLESPNDLNSYIFDSTRSVEIADKLGIEHKLDENQELIFIVPKAMTVEKFSKNRCKEVDPNKLVSLGLIDSEDLEFSNAFELYILEELEDDEKEALIAEIDFSVVEDYKVIDLQGANLGDIEKESFSSLDEIIERLEVYFRDYKIIIVSKDFFEKELLDKSLNNKLITIKAQGMVEQILYQSSEGINLNIYLKEIISSLESIYEEIEDNGDERAYSLGDAINLLSEIKFI